MTDVVNLVSLMKMTLPSDTVTLCDGAFFAYDGDTYEAEDANFGTVGSIEPIVEGNGDELPIFRMTFLPKDDAAVNDLSSPTFQGSSIKFRIAEYNATTGVISGTPTLVFDGLIDRTVLNFDKGVRNVEFDIVSLAERLILKNASNSLTPRFHKSIWSGELGHDNAVDLEIPVAWGVESPNRATTGGGGINRYLTIQDQFNVVLQ